MTYWNNDGEFAATLDALHQVINEKFYFDTNWMPKGTKGFENYHLERLRKAKNAYMRFYNDGDGGQAFRAAFGFALSDYKIYGTYSYHKRAYEFVEVAFNALIVAAAKEQKIALRGRNGRYVSKGA